jgi:hypothetical protein
VQAAKAILLWKYRLDRAQPLSWLIRRHPTMLLGLLLLALMSFVAVGASLWAWSAWTGPAVKSAITTPPTMYTMSISLRWTS